MSASKEDSKTLTKSWKKNEIPDGTKIPLFNVILKKCTTKALQLEEELLLPSHIPMPQLRPQSKKE